MKQILKRIAVFVGMIAAIAYIWYLIYLPLGRAIEADIRISELFVVFDQVLWHALYLFIPLAAGLLIVELRRQRLGQEDENDLRHIRSRKKMFAWVAILYTGLVLTMFFPGFEISWPIVIIMVTCVVLWFFYHRQWPLKKRV